MSEIGGGDDDGKEVGGSGQESGNETESASSAETSSSVEDSGTLEGTGPVEGIGARGEGSPTGPTETGGGRGIENVSVSPREITTQSHEVPHGKSQILETPASLEQTQKDVESYHQQSIEQILALNGKYMSEEDRARVAAQISPGPSKATPTGAETAATCFIKADPALRCRPWTSNRWSGPPSTRQTISPAKTAKCLSPNLTKRGILYIRRWARGAPAGSTRTRPGKTTTLLPKAAV